MSNLTTPTSKIPVQSYCGDCQLVPVVHEAAEDAELFSYSDRTAQQKQGLRCEARG